MNIKYKRYKNTLIITPNGELDHHNIEKYRSETDRSFSFYNARNIIFDLSEVNFIDSSGLGYILGRYKLTLFAGGKTAVVIRGEAVGKIFRCAGLDKIIKTYPSVEAAKADIFKEVQKA